MEERGTSGGYPSMDPTAIDYETEFSGMNGTAQVYPSKFNTKTLIQNLLIIVIALVGLTGNSIVLWLLGFRMQRNAISVYILNLAGADFLFLCTQTVYALERLVSSFLSISISIPYVFTTMLTFFYITGLSILSSISTERCLSIRFPIWYRCHRPTHMSVVTCALLWALSLMLSLLEGKFCGFLFWKMDRDLCLVSDLVILSWSVFLFVLLSGSSLVLLVSLWCGSQRIQLTRLYVTIGLTVLVFLLCGLAWGIHSFLLFWIQYEFHMFHYEFYQAVDVLSCVNSCANPIIYFFVGSARQRWQQRWKPLKLVLKRAFQDTPEDQGEGSFPLEILKVSRSSQIS